MMMDEAQKVKGIMPEMGNSGGLFAKVMTDDQLELLRRQISAYVVLSEQLADMHKSHLTSQQHYLSGMKLGSINYDPLIAYSGHKISSRQRWSPTPDQLEILERIFEQGNGTPSKQKIKAMTEQLSKVGQISETNVYNWFQNRRARSKRKQPLSAQNNVEPLPETQTHAKPENSEFYDNAASSHDHHHMYFPSPEELMDWPENASVDELPQVLPSWPGF